MTPLVTIPILCHNYGRFLPEAIESALAQTHPNLEIVVWDDGSTDGSAQVAARYSPEVEVVEQPNQGVIRTCNAAARRARGDYLAFLSADDRFEPRYIEELIATLAGAPDASFAYSDVRLFGAETGVRRAYPFSPAILATVGNFVNGSALTRRGDYLAIGGYDEALEGAGYEDWDLWLRMVESGRRGRYVPKPLLLWRRHAAGSRNPTNGSEVSRAAALVRSRHAALLERYTSSREATAVDVLRRVPGFVGFAPALRHVEDVCWRRFSRLNGRTAAARPTTSRP